MQRLHWGLLLVFWATPALAQQKPLPARPLGGKGLVPSTGEFKDEPAGKSAAKPAKPAAGKTTTAPAEELPGEVAFNQCRKLPPGKKVKVTLKPESELNDLIGWISTM